MSPRTMASARRHDENDVHARLVDWMRDLIPWWLWAMYITSITGLIIYKLLSYNCNVDKCVVEQQTTILHWTTSVEYPLYSCRISWKGYFLKQYSRCFDSFGPSYSWGFEKLIDTVKYFGTFSTSSWVLFPNIVCTCTCLCQDLCLPVQYLWTSSQGL